MMKLTPSSILRVMHDVTNDDVLGPIVEAKMGYVLYLIEACSAGGLQKLKTRQK